MPEWGHGKYGDSGGRHIARGLDAMAEGAFFRSSPDSARGFEARLRYLLEHRGGGEALHKAGLRPDVNRVVGWLTGDITPQRDTRAKVDRAYRQLRRENVGRQLRGRLRNEGRGRRATVEPLPPSAVPPHQRLRQAQFEDRELTIRPAQWDRFVDAWEDDDMEAMDDAWMDVAGDLGSPPEAYYEVAHVGFSA